MIFSFEDIKKCKETGDSKYTHEHKLGKVCFKDVKFVDILTICLEEQLLKSIT